MVTCRWCGDEFLAIKPKDAPVQDMVNRVYYHKECRQEYRDFVKWLDMELQQA